MTSPPSDLVGRSKQHRHHSVKMVALWAITLITAVLFVAAAVPELGGYGFFEQRFRDWGYPHWLELVVGVAEVVGAIFLVLPVTAFYAAVVLMVIMVGAVATHLVLGTAAYALAPLALFVALALIGWMRRPQTLRTDQPRVTTSVPRGPNE